MSPSLREQIDAWLAANSPVRRVPDQWSSEDLARIKASNSFLQRLMGDAS